MPALIENIPLVQEASGDIRIEGSRIFLEHLAEKFKQGKSPEEIAQDFPSLKLVDIYSVITYYLRHQDEVDAYLVKQKTRAKETQVRLEKYASSTIRQRIKSQIDK